MLGSMWLPSQHLGGDGGGSQFWAHFRVNDEALSLFLKAHKRKVQPLITVLAELQDLQRKYIHTAAGLAMQSRGLPCAFLSLNPSLSEVEKSLPIDSAASENHDFVFAIMWHTEKGKRSCDELWGDGLYFR